MASLVTRVRWALEWHDDKAERRALALRDVRSLGQQVIDSLLGLGGVGRWLGVPMGIIGILTGNVAAGLGLMLMSTALFRWSVWPLVKVWSRQAGSRAIE